MSRRAPTESATARLSRLLTMVPWLLAHQGVPVDDAAAQFGISREQLQADLALLFVCGTPGHLPDDLIEADWEDGRVFIGNADAIARPLRLTVDEALTLMVGLRALAANPGITERDAVLAALAKLEQATGSVAEAASRVRVSLDDAAAQQVLASARGALQQRRRVRLRYQAFGRDEVSERDVDPIRVVNLDSHWYLEGWCHRAQDTRLFRLDRVDRLEVLEVSGVPPVPVQPRDLAGQVYVPSQADLTVVVELQRDAAWFADYYPNEGVVPLGEGRSRVTLKVTDPTWVRRAAWRMGGSLTVVSPAELVASVRDGAAAALGAYAGPDCQPAPGDG